ncbi:MAG: hypothetical protein K6D94_09630, partial [Clostridiales bacterium]|nr:hypothetical protein [Clostridiales bacterium]
KSGRISGVDVDESSFLIFGVRMYYDIFVIKAGHDPGIADILPDIRNRFAADQRPLKTVGI